MAMNGPIMYGPKGPSGWGDAAFLFGHQGIQGPQGGGGSGFQESYEIIYDNPTYTTVQAALDHLLYVAPSVSLSGGSTNEKGSTVVDVSLAWTCNKIMATRALSAPVPAPDRDRGPGQNGSYTHLGASLTTTTTYSITVGDGTGFALSNTSVAFYNRRYYGTNASPGPLTNGQILALESMAFATGRGFTATYDCSGGKYIWVCYPASLGLATFTVGGFLTIFDLTVQSVTNSSGYSENFNCYRSDVLQHGSGIVVVVS